MKRGFSLVGLLGIIVFCVVVYLLVYPRIVMIRMRNNIRSEAAEITAGEVIDAAKFNYAESLITDTL